jgi:hypothetical protein
VQLEAYIHLTFLDGDEIICAVRRHLEACFGSRMDDSRQDDMLNYSGFQADCCGATIEERPASTIAVQLPGSKSGRQ